MTSQDLATLNGDFSGDVIQPSDAGYEEARAIYNAMIKLRPAVIARPRTAQDVATAVKYARANDLPIAVRGGGHGVAGFALCDDGLVIDLSQMISVDVDPEARTARVGGGAKSVDVDKATQEHGLVVPIGRVTTTGVGGFTLGGGYGWLSDAFGLACDNMIEAQVVTAEGEIVTASESENSDLLWGLRGGGGNFGVVTEFTFRLHECGPMVCAGLLLYEHSKSVEVATAWREFNKTTSPNLGTALAFITAPPEEFVPEHMRMKPACGIAICHGGSVEEGLEVVAPLKQAAPPDVDLVGPMPYMEFQAILDVPGGQPGFQNYWKGEYVRELTDDAIKTLAKFTGEPPHALTQTVVFRLGGKISDVGELDTALSHRDAPYMLHPIGMWEDPAENDKNIAWVKGLAEEIAPALSGNKYVNFNADLGDDQTEASYIPEKYERLVALKDKYDPDNVFALNQNIKPSGRRPEPAAA